MLYSSLLKRGMTCVSDEKTCIVDTNEIIARKLEDFEKSREGQAKGGFRAGLQVQELELTDYVEEEDGLAAILGEEQLVEMGPSPEELLAEAREQIFKMEDEARSAIEADRIRITDEARNEGYSHGYAEGQQRGMAQYEQMMRELEAQRAEMLAEYQQRIEELEPQFIDTLTGIYEHLFKVEIGEHRELIVNLISNALNQVEGAKNYLVHVSKDDYAYVSMQKKEIQDSVMAGANASVEIIEDISLSKNECLIETEGGIFDCGLGTQLSELTRRLKLLSYEKE